MIAAVCALLASLSAAPAPAGPPVSVIAHVRAGSAADPACLRGAVVGFLAGHGVAATWAAPENAGSDHVTRGAGRVITAEIDLREPARAALTFTDSAGGAPLLREVALQHGLDDVGCEALADVIESVVLALIADTTANTTANPPESPPGPVAVSPPPGPLLTARAEPRPDAAGTGQTLSLAYVIQPVAWGIPQQGIELVAASAPRRYRQRTAFRLSYTFPVTVSAEQAAARWQTLTMAGGLSTSSRGRRAWIESAFWLGADVTRLETTTTQTNVTFQWAADVTVGVLVAPGAAMFASFRFAFVDPIILEANQRRVFESWWDFRPSLVIGGRWL